MKKKLYDQNAIITLEALEHIRLRAGMYIGRLGDGSHIDDGIYVLLKEVIDNSVDEFVMGHGSQIIITFDDESGVLAIRDYGRGIPLEKTVDCVSKINTGAKYNDDVFQFSVGLNGVGLKAVNALSSHFKVSSFRNKKGITAFFEQGRLISETSFRSKEENGTLIEFLPDSSIFKQYAYDLDIIRKRLFNYAYLNTGLTLIFNGESILSLNGLTDLIDAEFPLDRLYAPFHYKDAALEFAFVHAQHYGEIHYSFVNGQHTTDGGTHLSAFREGLSRGINDFSGKNFQGADVREGLIGCIAIKIKEPFFESQTKNKLGNTEIKAPLVQSVKTAVAGLLYRNKDNAKILIDRLIFNKKVREELSVIKKEAKEKQKKISVKIPKLRDCKFHYSDKNLYGQKSMIFLTEGESASASVLAARDPLTQAVFSLRGKPVNVHGMKADLLYKNEEMFYLMNALNIEHDLTGLRYNKVILATDADVDGMHIRNLLLTFFWTYFENLVIQGHIFILETPLFKVRSPQTTLYCYSEEEKISAVNSLKTGTSTANIEITRFKGLGEISPKEFKQFIGKDIRLKSVDVFSHNETRTMLEFYMGKNTPTRKDFIMNNLIREE
ncbi:toprim domain-containing protein [Candidatus Clavichlamydia salmonicola]|uniref:toprim domain-containing protein n=1 Tax=Candidatus Clavichlamydia salmonicola TaxID=469812 RepID=UPI0018917D1F|nr:toprim domain-containing protein [Candidatus Clavichlamydia salmonicola]